MLNKNKNFGMHVETMLYNKLELKLQRLSSKCPILGTMLPHKNLKLRKIREIFNLP